MNQYPIDYYSLEHEQNRISEFKIKNVETFSLAQDVYVCGRWLVDAILHHDFGHFVERELIQKTLNFYHNSILLCMAEKPQLGLASARIGIETTRDLLRILEDESLRELFLKITPTQKEINEYKRKFRFQTDSDDFEDALFAFYNFTSDYGIHSKMQLHDPVGIAEISTEQRFKIARQKTHSLRSARVVIISEFVSMSLIFSKASSKLMQSTSADVSAFCDLFSRSQTELLSRIINMSEFSEFKVDFHHQTIH